MPFHPHTGALESITLTADQNERLFAQCKEHYEEGITARGDWPTRHDKRYRRVLADPRERPEGPWPGAPRLFTSDTRRALETILSQLWTAVFPGFESISLEHPDALDQQARERLEKATLTERWILEHDINDVDLGGFAGISYTALYDALCDSVGFLKVYPWRPPWKNATPDTIIRIDNVDEGTLLIPPGATGTQYPNAEYFGQEIWARWDDLVRKKAHGFTIPDREAFREQARQITEIERTYEEREGRQPPEGQSHEYLCAELYERFALEEDGEEDDIVVSWYPHMDQDSWLGRVVYVTDLYPNQPRPLRPFFPIRVWPQPRQLRGLNVPDRLETAQDVLNRLAEQAINYGDVSILPFFFYNALITGDIPDLRQVMPGQGVPVNDLNGVTTVQRGSLNQHFLQMSQVWRAEVEGDVHVSDASQGRAPTRPNAPRTLGGTMLLLQQGREAFKIVVNLLKYQFREPIQFHWRLWQHYIPPGYMAPVQRVQPAQQRRTRPSYTFFNDYDPFGANGAAPNAAAPGAADTLLGEPQAMQMMTPEREQFQTVAIRKEDIAGPMRVHLAVNPDLPFDRQILTQMGMQLVQLIRPVYPLGARVLLKRIWEINAQTGFDQIYPEMVALMETQRIYAQVLAQAQQQQAMMQQQQAQQQAQGAQGPQQPPQARQGPDEQTVAAQNQAMQHGAHHTMQRNEMQTAQQFLQVLGQMQKLLGTGQNGEGGRE